MRFVLYFFTWFFIVETIGNLVRGEIDQFVAGLFLSGLMVWWSVAVRNKRKKKLSGGTSKEAKPRGNRFRARGASKAEGSAPVTELKNETDSPPAVSLQETPQDSVAEAIGHESVFPETVAPEAVEPAREQASIGETTPASSLTEVQGEPEAQPEPVEATPAPERPLWTDAQLKPLHVGANVSFLANSRGQSVSIPGVLLGERYGKALIEVGSGALLPKNDYSIPWNVVSLVE